MGHFAFHLDMLHQALSGSVCKWLGFLLLNLKKPKSKAMESPKTSLIIWKSFDLDLKYCIKTMLDYL